MDINKIEFQNLEMNQKEMKSKPHLTNFLKNFNLIQLKIIEKQKSQNLGNPKHTLTQ